MKITVEHTDVEENEIILRCKSIDEEMLHILSLLKSRTQKLCVFKEKSELILLSPDSVFYCESVDEKVFVYTKEDVFQTGLNLAEIESSYSDVGFLRISKSIIINLHKIKSLKSYTSGRIEVYLKSNEKVIVSRHYAPILRQKLERK
ncbi:MULTISPECIES: LytTR family DNA-binding domain-containing protein [Clostridium]|uniref:LytTR family DNA-binding domain-containing protein n=1 Tax=Clostridium TaxID=1485 RepID=UPI000781A1E5|nr:MULTISPECIES: LytTR family DNA-binding domain-containing protein [Clostridium]MBU5226258.1 LytTR family transcriptional regulator [Clostridium senegalense]